MNLPTFTIEDIRSWSPCYDPAKFIPEDWKGTALDILNIEDCPAIDRLWVVLRDNCIHPRIQRLFGVWCAREALKLVPNPDPRSVAACDVAERYANGDATDEELAAAWDAAGAAAWDAARAAAWDAAWAAAGAAARDAAWAAAGAAARDAARDAAWDAARDAQIEQLKSMLQ